MKLGFIGTGKIASSVIIGICNSKIEYKQITSVEEVEVYWPDGKRTMLNSPAIEQYHNIKHNDSLSTIIPAE